MEANSVKIPFFHPIERTRIETSTFSNIVYALYDVAVDSLLSSPLASKTYKIQENGVSNGKKRFIVISDHADFPMGCLGYLCSKVILLFGLIYFRKSTSMALAIGLALKWMQKWMCESYFYLFALGMTETSIIPEIPLEDVSIKVFIGEDAVEYPQAFLSQLPFFKALMRSGMSEMCGNEIRLSMAFRFTHEDLKALQQKLESADASKWGDLEAYDFLCIGMREEQAPAVTKLAEIQQAIQSRNFESLNPYLQCLQNRHQPPGVKAGSHSLNFLPSIELINSLSNISDVEERISATKKALDQVVVLHDLSEPLKCYYCNKMIDELISFLHFEANRKKDIDILNFIYRILDKSPNIRPYITILSLSSHTSFQSHLFPQLLQLLPNLLWLQIDLFIEKLIVMDERGEELQQANFASFHKNLRVLSISGQRFSPGQKETLESFFPSVDVMEIEVRGG